MELSRARNIKPGFFKNEDLAKCAPLARILFAGLWTVADKQGRLEDRPDRIKVDTLPYDNCDIDELLNQLATRGFIARYISDGRPCIQVVTFSKHARPHQNEPESELPAPPATRNKSRKVPINRVKSRQDALVTESLKLNAELLNPEYIPAAEAATSKPSQSVTAPETPGNPPDLPALEETSSDTLASGTGPETNGSPKKPRARDLLFDAVAEVTGSDPKASAAFIGRVCRSLRAADPPYTPEEVRRWAEIVTGESWWEGGYPSLGLLNKNIGRVRAQSPPAKAANKLPRAPTAAELNALAKELEAKCLQTGFPDGAKGTAPSSG